MKRVRIKSWGGFHNASPIYTILTVCDEWKDMTDYGEPWWLYASKGQIRRLAKHFCGIKDCSCGGFLRAKHEVVGEKKI